MRYQDWDVLLFPCGEDAHIPVKEFRTQCYSELPIDGSPNQIPLLTSFVPSLHAGAPFQISVHSWVRTKRMLGTFEDGTKPEEFWQVRVVVDGELVGTKHFACEGPWPQIISTMGSPALGQMPTQLRFPPFHHELMGENHWNAADRRGRIRVELSAGYVHPGLGRLSKMCDVVTFAFQPAPLDVLESCGVAWPNARLISNAQVGPPYTSGPVCATDIAYAATPRKVTDAQVLRSNTTPLGAASLPAHHPNSPLNPYTNDPNSNYDGSSRSTSAYSAMPESAAPLLAKPLGPIPTFQPLAEGPKKPHLSVRLPSDQIEKIISAIAAKTQAPEVQPVTATTTTMPPPPLPQHALTAKANEDQANDNIVIATKPAAAVESGEIISRRGQSTYSDVSMHNDCIAFPTCTSEDTEGRLVHSAPSAPAMVVKGKKEGSATGTKPRDFFSTILDTEAAPLTLTESSTATELMSLVSLSPAETPARKRTRSALKSLNLNDGSPAKNGVAKPKRKASRSISSANPDKENVRVQEEDGMVLDV